MESSHIRTRPMTISITAGEHVSVNRVSLTRHLRAQNLSERTVAPKPIIHHYLPASLRPDNLGIGCFSLPGLHQKQQREALLIDVKIIIPVNVLPFSCMA